MPTALGGGGRPGTRNLKCAAAGAVIIFHIACLFDAEGLKTWAERLPDPAVQSVLLPPLEAWYGFSRAVGASFVRSFIRDSLFPPVRDAAFPAAARPSPAPSPVPATAPAASSPEAPAAPVFSAERPLEVLLLGDSLAGDTLPIMLNQAVAPRRSVRVTVEVHSASSIARPAYYDWPVELKKILAAQLAARGRIFDLAVVVIGSNDAQTLRSRGAYVEFNSPGWRELFRARADEFMTILSSGAGRVYWCAVPPMRQEGYRDRMTALNALYREIAAGRPNIRWLSLDFLGDENGRYVQTKVLGRAEREIRSADGVHLHYAGAELLVNRLFALINVDFTFARPEDRPEPSTLGE